MEIPPQFVVGSEWYNRLADDIGTVTEHHQEGIIVRYKYGTGTVTYEAESLTDGRFQPLAEREIEVREL